ncbi:MAG: hypothetical protein P1P86_04845 [Bacteroidales bacterium]|nr:hypothetical protein [Bacteroidales bacterium]
MKRTFTPISRFFTTSVTLLLVSVIALTGQTPGTFNYQAVLRDAQGDPRSGESVSIELEIHQTTATGTIVYSEIHNTTTTDFGIVNLEVGSVNPVSFGAIDWSAGPYFVEVSVNGTSMGVSELLTVPYALYASEIAPGAVGSAEIAANAVGTNEVQDGSLTSADLLDEPAIRQSFSSIWNTLTDSYNDIASVTVTAPADGYFYVTGTGTISLEKSSSAAAGFWGMDLHTAPDTGPGVIPMMGSHSATRGYFQSSWIFTANMGIPFHLMEVFPVVQGTSYSYYLNGIASGFSAASVFHPSIVVLFVPSSM